jgi:glyoxylase-like metal-dependent hydrolase (beta-lactamase superfamily II)
MILRALVVGRLKTNCYLVGCPQTHEGATIDPGGDAQEILAAADDLGVHVRQIVLTHFHFDHTLAVGPVRTATGASLAIHKDDAPYLTNPPALFRFFAPNIPRGLVADRLLQDGEILTIGELSVKVLHTPGHSPGGISLWIAAEGVVFSGDTLFREGLGRTDFPGCDHQALIRSIRGKLFALPDETIVYPGHGPETTIGHERRHNPWVGGRTPG